MALGDEIFDIRTITCKECGSLTTYTGAQQRAAGPAVENDAGEPGRWIKDEDGHENWLDVHEEQSGGLYPTIR